MFFANNVCKLYRAKGALTVRGERSYERFVDVPCAVVDLSLTVQRTSVRADSSGSRGRAEEEQGKAILLFPPYIVVREKDVVVVDGETLEADGVFPRRDVLGRLDHYQVSFVKGNLQS